MKSVTGCSGYWRDELLLRFTPQRVVVKDHNTLRFHLWGGGAVTLKHQKMGSNFWDQSQLTTKYHVMKILVPQHLVYGKGVQWGKLILEYCQRD
jgi:hypothetical protein